MKEKVFLTTAAAIANIVTFLFFIAPHIGGFKMDWYQFTLITIFLTSGGYILYAKRKIWQEKNKLIEERLRATIKKRVNKVDGGVS